MRKRWKCSELEFLFVLAVGLVAGTLGGIVGFGASIMLMPVLVIAFGPLTAPIFLATGLAKGAFLSTEAAASLAVYLAKAVVFRSFGALPLEIVSKGLIVGATLMAGAFIAKRFVLKMEPERFRLLMDALMLLSGATLLWAAFV